MKRKSKLKPVGVFHPLIYADDRYFKPCNIIDECEVEFGSSAKIDDIFDKNLDIDEVMFEFFVGTKFLTFKLERRDRLLILSSEDLDSHAVAFGIQGVPVFEISSSLDDFISEIDKKEKLSGKFLDEFINHGLFRDNDFINIEPVGAYEWRIWSDSSKSQYMIRNLTERMFVCSDIYKFLYFDESSKLYYNTFYENQIPTVLGSPNITFFWEDRSRRCLPQKQSLNLILGMSSYKNVIDILERSEIAEDWVIFPHWYSKFKEEFGLEGISFHTFMYSWDKKNVINIEDSDNLEHMTFRYDLSKEQISQHVNYVQKVEKTFIAGIIKLLGRNYLSEGLGLQVSRNLYNYSNYFAWTDGVDLLHLEDRIFWSNRGFFVFPMEFFGERMVVVFQIAGNYYHFEKFLDIKVQDDFKRFFERYICNYGFIEARNLYKKLSTKKQINPHKFRFLNNGLLLSRTEQIEFLCRGIKGRKQITIEHNALVESVQYQIASTIKEFFGEKIFDSKPTIKKGYV